MRLGMWIGLAVVGGVACWQPASAQSVFDSKVEATPGLLGYYPFTPSSQANSAVNGYTGMLEGDATIGGPNSGPPVHYTPTTAMVLPETGTGDAVAGGSMPLEGMIDQSGSVMAWFRLTELASTAGRVLSVAGESQNGNDLDLQIDTDNCLHFYTEGGASTTSSRCFTSTDLKKWFFVVGTFVVNGPRDIYLNGKLVGTTTAGPHSLNNALFYVGESPVFTGRYFPGSISDAGLFDKTLTSHQVTALYKASKQSAADAANQR